ncbi:FecR family protein [Bacteroides sp. UBA939]|uniref:FecR family protein n=1 Tax=Bacteroides sp. UBA939 TaxID=1946092 RepID=UPI0025C3F21B|nr:FecR domain-containing protein [Bacteroides sp. UBA939]
MKKEIPWSLIILKLKKESTVEEDHRLGAWLADSGNREVFEELRMLWDKIQTNASNYTPDTDYYWKELTRRMKAGVTVQTGEPNRKRIFRMWKYVAAACIIVAVSFSFYLGHLANTPDDVFLEYKNIGGKSIASLPDRSSVWLHTNTKLNIDMQHQKDERIVTMQHGEAYFDVAHDKNKPFIVQIDGVRIVVHGTKFNVEAFPDMENIYVSLLEGSVSLDTEYERRLLSPGETATYNKNSRRLSVSKDDVLFAASWTKDQIVFEQRSLRDICRFLGKWYHVKIYLDPAIADNIEYTFTLRNEPLEEILRLMARINPIGYTFNEENELSIYKSKKLNSNSKLPMNNAVK